MTILGINLFLCILYALFLKCAKLKDSDSRKIYFILAFIQIFILRTVVEPNSIPDLATYVDIFDLSKETKVKDILLGEYLMISESGYFLLCKISSLVSDNFHFLLAIISLIWIYSYFNLFKKYSKYFAISIIILLLTEFPQSLFVLRQHLAIAIWLFAYPAIINRNLKNFIFIGILATSMHKTGLFFFPVYFLYGIMSKKTFLPIILLLSFVAFIGFKALDIVNELLGLAYDNYISGNKSGESNLTGFAIRFTYFLSYIFFCRDKIFESGINKLLTTMLVIALILAFWGISFSLTGRIIRYFSPAIMLMVPIVMSNIKCSIIKYIYISCIIILNIYLTFIGSMSEFIVDYRLII